MVSRYADLILTAAWTGARQGEVLGLQWGDIDFTGWFIEIKRTVSYRQHRLLVGSRKSGKARRVDMAKALAPRLQARRSLLEVEAAYEGRALPLWAFPNEVGGPLDAMHCLHRVWYPLLQKGGPAYPVP